MHLLREFREVDIICDILPLSVLPFLYSFTCLLNNRDRGHSVESKTCQFVG